MTVSNLNGHSYQNLKNQVATSDCNRSQTGQEVISDLFFCATIFENLAGVEKHSTGFLNLQVASLPFLYQFIPF